MNGKSPSSVATPLEKAEAARARLLSAPEDEPSEVTEVTVGKEGLRAKGVPPKHLGVAIILLALAAIGWVALEVAR